MAHARQEVAFGPTGLFRRFLCLAGGLLGSFALGVRPIEQPGVRPSDDSKNNHGGQRKDGYSKLSAVEARSLPDQSQPTQQKWNPKRGGGENNSPHPPPPPP